MASSSDILIRAARREDLPELARIFVAAFPESVAHVAGSLSTTQGLQDMFALVLDAESAALQVAEREGRLIGYVLAPSRTSRLRAVAFWRGHALRSAWRWVTGQYGVRWQAFRTSLRDKLTFLRSAKIGEHSDARILSLAVDPAYQGQGVGKRLLAAGLQHLSRQGVPTVRLEVRPDNAAARHLYEQAGFQPVGSYADAQGPWLVMIKRFSPRSRPRWRRRRWRWHRWLVAAALLSVAGWSLSSFLINRPLYLANLRLRVEMQFLPVPSAGQRVMIFAPHPDDEVLACGGLIQQAQAAGAQVHVVLMTNGDASEYALLYWEKTVRRTAEEYLSLGRSRERESRSGLGILDLPPSHLHVLGYPNGGLENLWQPAYWLPETPWTSPHTRAFRNPYRHTYRPQALYCGSHLLYDISRLLSTLEPDMVVAPAPFDGHPDHWAAYNFVKLALEQQALRQPGKQPPLYCYLVHRRDWPAPVGYHPRELLRPPADFAHTPHLEWYALPLSEEQVQRKTRALSMYRSQAPQWDRLLLALVRHNELFAEVFPLERGLPEMSLVEPIRDQPAVRARPSADLALFNLRLGPRFATVSLLLAGNVDPRLTYVVTGHSPQANGPSAWELTVRGSRGILTSVQAGGLHRQELPVTIQQDMLSAQLPLEYVQERPLLVQAHTTTGRRYLDHTITRSVVLTPRLP